MAELRFRNNGQAVIDERRTFVARFAVRGATQREIVKSLKKQGFTNPKTERPWAIGTVNRDLRAIRLEWRVRYARSYDEHVTYMLAEIRELRRQGWRDKNYKLILSCMDRECKLMGLDQPDRLVVDWREEAEQAGITDAGEIFEQLVQVAAAEFDKEDVGGGDPRSVEAH